MSYSISILILFILLILIFLLNSSEVALLAVNKLRLNKLSEEGKKQAKIALSLINKPSDYLSAIIVGITLSITIGTAIATSLVENFLGDKWIPIIVFIWTFLILTFGEILPKVITVHRPEFFALKESYFIKFFVFFLSPLIKLLINIISIFLKPFGISAKEYKPLITEDDIKMLINAGEEEGVLKEETTEMIEGIFELRETMVKEVMIPRIDIVCLNVESSLNEVLDLVFKKGHSRIPVYEESIDKIIGILYVKDLLRYFHKDEINLREVLRKVYFVPENKKIDELLKEMQRAKVHIAIVVDEYGGTAGLVTIEDLIEEIVGEIQDEYDKEEPLYKIIDENQILVSARLNIDEANETLGIALPSDSWDTIGGFIYNYLGRIPKEGEKINFQNLEIIVENVQAQRINKVKIVKKDV